MKEFVRIYELKENLTLDEGLISVKESDEQINLDDMAAMPTGRTFSIQDVKDKILLPSWNASVDWKKQSNSLELVNGSIGMNRQGDIYYCFEFDRDCTMQPNAQSVVTKSLMIKIPFVICEYMMSGQLDAAQQKADYKNFIKMLETIKNIGNRRDLDKRAKKYRLQKRNQYVKTTIKVAGAFAAAIAIPYFISKIPAITEYIGEQQQNQRELEQMDYMRNPFQTISEKQQQRILLEQDPDMQQYLNGILEEHQNEGKQF